jgi:hypothetical protein
MIELGVDPCTHIATSNFTDSELVIVRWNPESRRLLIGFDDLSEKIPDWVAHGPRTRYFFRYKLLECLGVQDLARPEVQEPWVGRATDYLITRDEGRIPIDDITAARRADTFAVTVGTQGPFGALAVRCAHLRIYEATFFWKCQRDGKAICYVGPDPANEVDADTYLLALYESDDLTAFLLPSG